MGRMIVTKTTVSKTPYWMKESGHPLYSYEELCYYMKTRLPLWLLEEDREGLTKWIRQRGVELPDTDNLSPSEAAAKIIGAGNYFWPQEAASFLCQIEEYEKKPEKYREKEKGDWYLHYGKLIKACFAYEKAKRLVNGREEQNFLSSLNHNIGLIYCRFFYWPQAEECFLKALESEDREETQKALSFVQKMKEERWEMGGGPVDLAVLEQKKKEFLEELM